MNKHEALKAMLDGAKVKHGSVLPASAYLSVADGDARMHIGATSKLMESWINMPADGYYTFTPPMTDDEIVKEFRRRADLSVFNPSARKSFEYCAKVLMGRSLTDKESW